MIIEKGKAKHLIQKSSVVPDGVEYEQLMRDLRKHTYEKYKDVDDLRKVTDGLGKMVEQENQDRNPNICLNPNMLIEYENPQSDTNPYPVSDIPSKDGVAWSDLC